MIGKPRGEGPQRTRSTQSTTNQGRRRVFVPFVSLVSFVMKNVIFLDVGPEMRST